MAVRTARRTSRSGAPASWQLNAMLANIACPRRERRRFAVRRLA